MEQKVLGIVSPVPMGNWASNTVYQNLNIVRHNGASYIAKSSNTNIEPGVTVGWGSYWMLLNDDGEIGPTGPQGIPGEGVPAGGLAGYVLSKNSNTNYDSKWIPQNEIAAGSAEKDGQGNIIADTYETKQNAQQTYETKSDSMQKYTSLQSQITQNTQNISRNSKRLDGLEQRINPSPFVTDNSVAYQKDVPSNAVGAVDIQVIGGMTYKDGNTLRSAPVTEVKGVGANLIPFPYSENSKTMSGITFTVNDDGGITVNGTATDTAVFSIKDNGSYIKLSELLGVPEGQYTFSGIKKSGFYTDILSNVGANIEAGQTFNTENYSQQTFRNIRIVVLSGITVSNETVYPMLNKGSTALPYTPYVEHTLPIPTAVQALDGYGEGNPDNAEEYNAIIKKDGKWKYSHKGNIENNLWLPLATPEITDISNLITLDNLLSIQGNGILTFENEYGYAVPSTVEYITAEATA